MLSRVVFDTGVTMYDKLTNTLYMGNVRVVSSDLSRVASGIFHAFQCPTCQPQMSVDYVLSFNWCLQKKTDEGIVPVKNSICALRKGLFDVTRDLMGIESLPLPLPGFEANFKKVTVWVIREMRLHDCFSDEIVFNLKIDGCPFFGMQY